MKDLDRLKEMDARIQVDMVVHAKGKGSDTRIGRVIGLKKHRYIKLSKRDTPDGERRYIPLEWVETIEGKTVQLSMSAETVRREWLGKSAIRHRKSGG